MTGWLRRPRLAIATALVLAAAAGCSSAPVKPTRAADRAATHPTPRQHPLALDTRDALHVSLAVSPDGRSTVAWSAGGPNGETAVAQTFAKTLDRWGRPLGRTLEIVTSTGELRPEVAVGQGGRRAAQGQGHQQHQESCHLFHSFILLRIQGWVGG